MKQTMTVEQVMDYIGIERRSVFYWRQKKLNFDSLIIELQKCESYRCQRNIFYKTFLKFTNETVVDRLWNIYIKHKLGKDELEKKRNEARKKIQKMLQEKREGRIT